MAHGVLFVDQKGVVLVVQEELAVLYPLLVSYFGYLLQIQLRFDVLPFELGENRPSNLAVGLNFGKVVQSNTHNRAARAFTMTLTATFAVTAIFVEGGYAPIHLNHDLTVI